VAKILIVDDDVTITGLMKTLLTMEGHQPTTVNDSTTALDAADRVKPDLITLDLMMPDLTGFDLCEMLQRDSRFVNIPVVIVSAKDDHESKEKALQIGAKGFISKPFSIDTLLETIDQLTHP
jgi:DNA-binding response OmpR family regulator